MVMVIVLSMLPLIEWLAEVLRPVLQFGHCVPCLPKLCSPSCGPMASCSYDMLCVSVWTGQGGCSCLYLCGVPFPCCCEELANSCGAIAILA